MKAEEYDIDGHKLRIESQERADVTTRAFGSHVLVSKGVFGFAGEIQAIYLYRMMLECVEQNWSGAFYFYLPDGKKVVYFRNGQIVFATSEVMEDRLGEVLFRQGRLSLETQMDCSVRVTKDKRFGEVLLQSSVFNHAQLLSALALQVRQIVQSFFQYPMVCVEVVDAVVAPQEIILIEGARRVLDAAWGDGVVLQRFVERVVPDQSVEMVARPGVTGAGTFLGDFLEILQEAPAPRDLLRASRLGAVGTWVALLNVVARGWVRIPHLKPLTFETLPEELVSLLGVYQRTVRSVVESSGVSWVQELQRYALELNHSEHAVPCLFLNENGYLDRLSIDHMLVQSESLGVQVAAFQRRVTLLLHLLRQVSGISIVTTQDHYETQKHEKVSPDQYQDLYAR